MIGADNWCVFDQWKDGEEIINNFHILIYPRRGYEIKIPARYKDRGEVVDAPLVELSSTQIREMLSQMQSISFYVPEAVERYIVENKLYME